MAEFLTTSGTSHHIENIIIEAKRELVLLSPYLQLSKTFYERLKDATNRGVNATIIYGKDELKPNEKDSLGGLKNLELYFFENLHAKCYFNESEMVITSMNMYEFSEKRNREMGVWITKATDSVLYQKAWDEAISIRNSAERIPLAKDLRVYHSYKDQSGTSILKPPTYGYCIRCQNRIPYNPVRPYCGNCYNIWAQFANENYEENCCHRCGKFERTSMRAPQDYECYSAYQKEIYRN